MPLSVFDSVDGGIVKATEGTGYVNPSCDVHVQYLVNAGKLWGFYHFAGNYGPVEEADYFYNNCKDYFGHGIPVLDWEGNQSVEWVNAWVNRIFELAHVWPWIYANPWRFNQGGVSENCGRWVASYPNVASPTFDQAASWDVPETDGLVCAWQFCSDGVVGGYGPLDCSIYYGGRTSWLAYAQAGEPGSDPGTQEPDENEKSQVETVETAHHRITIEEI